MSWVYRRRQYASPLGSPLPSFQIVMGCWGTAVIAVYRTTPGSETVVGLGSFGSDSYPVWNPARTKFAANYGGAIVICNPASGAIVQVLTLPAVGSTPVGTATPRFDWSPDGTEIAVQWSEGGQDGIAICKVDGSSQTFVPLGPAGSTFSDGGLFWSPDGSKFMYTIPPHGLTGFDTISVCNADGSGQTMIALDGPSPCGWFDDSAHVLAYTFINGGLPYQVLLRKIDLTGTIVLNYTGDIVGAGIFGGRRGAAISPDGTQIVVTQGRFSADPKCLALINADGSGGIITTFAHVGSGSDDSGASPATVDW